MRRMMVVAVVMMVAVCAVALTGCGGDTTQAKADAKAADARWNALNTKLNDLNIRSQALLKDALGGKAVSVSQAEIATVNTQTDALLAEIDSVKADYAKIKSLKGVGDYVKYADAMIAALDAYAATIKAGRALLEKFLPAITSGDTAALNAAVQAAIGDIDAVVKLRDDAAQKAAEGQALRNKLGYAK